MPAYIIARVDITDRQQYLKYTAVAPSVILRYGGRVVARSEDPVSLEGPLEKRRITNIEFPSVESAKEWYHSPEYCQARDIRKDAAMGELIIVDGFIPG